MLVVATATTMTSETINRIGLLNNTAKKCADQVLLTTLKTTVEMLQDRGYAHVECCQTLDEILVNMEETRCIVRGTKEGGSVVHVFFHNEDRVGVKQLRAWVESSVADHIVVVSLEGPTAFTRKESESHPNVQFFQFKDLCVNITRHSLVPRHEKVAADDMPLELSETKHELPLMYTSDRVAQYYDYRVGDIIRITRVYGGQEPLYYYRLVSAPAAC